MPAVTIRLTGELRPGRGDGRRGAGSGFGRQRPSTPTVVSGWERLAAVRLRSAATAGPAGGCRAVRPRPGAQRRRRAGAAESYHYAIGDLSDSTATGRHAAAGGQVARTAARSAASNGCPPVSIVGRPGASRDSGPSRSAGRAPAAEPESGSTPAPTGGEALARALPWS